MKSTARELMEEGRSIREVIIMMGGLDEMVRSIENDEDYALLGLRERNMIEEIKSALGERGNPGEESQPDDEAYYEEENNE